MFNIQIFHIEKIGLIIKFSLVNSLWIILKPFSSCATFVQHWLSNFAFSLGTIFSSSILISGNGGNEVLISRHSLSLNAKLFFSYHQLALDHYFFLLSMADCLCIMIYLSSIFPHTDSETAVYTLMPMVMADQHRQERCQADACFTYGTFFYDCCFFNVINLLLCSPKGQCQSYSSTPSLM